MPFNCLLHLLDFSFFFFFRHMPYFLHYNTLHFWTWIVVSHRDNLAPQESEVQKALRDREERLVIWAELDQLASGWISKFIMTFWWQNINQPTPNLIVSVQPEDDLNSFFSFFCKGTHGYRWWHRYKRTSGMYSYRIWKCICLLNTFVCYLRWDSTALSKFYRVILVLKVQVAILDPLVHQDLKEALVSLVSKDSW